MSEEKYVLGVDFGTDSVRSVIVDTADGKVLASYVVNFKRWGEGRFCDPSENRFRQHPLDYMEGLVESVNGALKTLPGGAGDRVAGIGVDTTGSTPAPVDESGTVLALRDDFADNPNAMFILWKDHTAVNEADKEPTEKIDSKSEDADFCCGIEAYGGLQPMIDWLLVGLTLPSRVSSIRLERNSARFESPWASHSRSAPASRPSASMART